MDAVAAFVFHSPESYERCAAADGRLLELTEVVVPELRLLRTCQPPPDAVLGTEGCLAKLLHDYVRDNAEAPRHIHALLCAQCLELLHSARASRRFPVFFLRCCGTAAISAAARAAGVGLYLKPVYEHDATADALLGSLEDLMTSTDPFVADPNLDAELLARSKYARDEAIACQMVQVFTGSKIPERLCPVKREVLLDSAHSLRLFSLHQKGVLALRRPRGTKVMAVCHGDTLFVFDYSMELLGRHALSLAGSVDGSTVEGVFEERPPGRLIVTDVLSVRWVPVLQDPLQQRLSTARSVLTKLESLKTPPVVCAKYTDISRCTRRSEIEDIFRGCGPKGIAFVGKECFYRPGISADVLLWRPPSPPSDVTLLHRWGRAFASHGDPARFLLEYVGEVTGAPGVGELEGGTSYICRRDGSDENRWLAVRRAKDRCTLSDLERLKRARQGQADGLSASTVIDCLCSCYLKKNDRSRQRKAQTHHTTCKHRRR